MPSQWNDATDRKLLLVIIQLLSPSPPKWSDVANAMGEGFTAEAVRQHYQKLRKEVTAVNTTIPKASPTKKGQAKSVSKGLVEKGETNDASQKRKAYVSPTIGDVDDEDEHSVLASKKRMLIKAEN